MTNPIQQAMDNLPGKWYRGNYTDGHGNYCGLGHVAKVIGDTQERDLHDVVSDMSDSKYWDIAKIMNDVAMAQYPKSRGFADVNDHMAKDENEVLAIMEKAAIQYDEKQGLTDSL